MTLIFPISKGKSESGRQEMHHNKKIVITHGFVDSDGILWNSFEDICYCLTVQVVCTNVLIIIVYYMH